MDDHSEKDSLQVPRLSGLQFTPRPSDVLAYEDDNGASDTGAMGYQQTLMYGRYSRSLGDELREEMKRQTMLEKTHRKELHNMDQSGTDTYQTLSTIGTMAEVKCGQCEQVVERSES